MQRADPRRLVSHAALHGVSCFVADILANAALELPPGPQQQLQTDARSLVGQGLRLRRLTLRVVDALAAVGVVPILLKGAGLAERLYPEQPLARPSSDVDVLVTPAELDRAGEVMRSLGFSKFVDPGLESVDHEHHHVSWSGKEGLVELHFRLFSGFGGNVFDDGTIRARLLDGTFHGRPVKWLNPEDEFVYLATHAANHSFLRASWLLDLQRILAASPSFDWARLARECRRAGFHTAVATALWVLQTALAVELPAEARRAFTVSRARALGHRVVFSSSHLEAADLAQHRWAGFGLRLWLVDSARDGLRHAADGARRFWRRARRT